MVCGLGFGSRWCGLLPWWRRALFRVRPGVLLLLWWLWGASVGGVLKVGGLVCCGCGGGLNWSGLGRQGGGVGVGGPVLYV